MAQSRNSYHKENLRRDLLEAGRRDVAEDGHQTLSIRTLAQTVKVSPGAPYHHFQDRRTFLLALAVEGFEEMLNGLRQTLAGLDGAHARLLAMGNHFIGFADHNPHLIDLMYESELTAPRLDPKLLAFQISAHAALRQEIAEAVPDIAAPEADLRAIAFWSAIYGFANMRRKGIIHSSGTPLATAEITSAIVDRAVLMATAA